MYFRRLSRFTLLCCSVVAIEPFRQVIQTCDDVYVPQLFLANVSPDIVCIMSGAAQEHTLQTS